MNSRINPLNILIMLVLAAMLVGAVTDEAAGSDTAVSLPTAPQTSQPAGNGGQLQPPSQPTAVPPDDPPLISPYADYFITQGHHGYSYGHMAIDLSGGKGSTILAPISGTVSQLYTDEWGNPTLVIDNARFTVTLLHGDYTVAVGDEVRQGQPIGSEGNYGYTTDMNGIPCGNGRDCGYHTHLNVYDKIVRNNIDPFLWIDYVERPTSQP